MSDSFYPILGVGFHEKQPNEKNHKQRNWFQIKTFNPMIKMTGGTPEVRSDKSLTLVTFNIRHSTNGPMDQQTNGPMDQWTNGLMD